MKTKKSLRNAFSTELLFFEPVRPSFSILGHRVLWCWRSLGIPNSSRLHWILSKHRTNLSINCTGSRTRSTRCRFSNPCFSNHYTKVSITFPLRQPRFYCLSSRGFVSNLCIQYGIIRKLLIVLVLIQDTTTIQVVIGLLLERGLFIH